MEQQILDGMYEQLCISKEVLDYAGAAGSFWNFGPDTGMKVFGLWK